jgi:hypothetical protein
MNSDGARGRVQRTLERASANSFGADDLSKPGIAYVKHCASQGRSAESAGDACMAPPDAVNVRGTHASRAPSRGPARGTAQSRFAFSVIAASSFAMSAGESCGRSTLIVSLLSLAVSANGGL